MWIKSKFTRKNDELPELIPLNSFCEISLFKIHDLVRKDHNNTLEKFKQSSKTNLIDKKHSFREIFELKNAELFIYCVNEKDK